MRGSGTGIFIRWILGGHGKHRGILPCKHGEHQQNECKIRVSDLKKPVKRLHCFSLCLGMAWTNSIISMQLLRQRFSCLHAGSLSSSKHHKQLNHHGQPHRRWLYPQCKKPVTPIITNLFPFLILPVQRIVLIHVNKSRGARSKARSLE